MTDENGDVKKLTEEVKRLREAIEARPWTAPFPLVITVQQPVHIHPFSGNNLSYQGLYSASHSTWLPPAHQMVMW